MLLLELWRAQAYNQNANKGQLQNLWSKYFVKEKEIYKQLLANPDEEVKGTVSELAAKYKTDLMFMTGFLDGINDSLKTPNPIETMEENTEVSLAFDKELLYKNMVGAFKMPVLVYMNLSTLSTLSERQYYNGFAEIMKHGLIKDASFYEWLISNMYEICDRDLDVLEEMIMHSCTIKKLVVEKDPTEQGERALLNFGHTIGHAIEKAKGFELLHGECVALGCVAAAYISWKRELLTMEEYYEIRDMFVPFNLPITVEDINPEEILKLTKSDKKMEAGKVKFVLLKRIGRSMVDKTVRDEEILAAIQEIYFSEEDMKA